LFKAHHKGMSKARVARESILQLNPSCNIEAHHHNIKELPISFFKGFQIIILALDNIEARYPINYAATMSTK
jgi:ubiquitin-like 1-activating enzyme E1 B